MVMMLSAVPHALRVGKMVRPPNSAHLALVTEALTADDTVYVKWTGVDHEVQADATQLVVVEKEPDVVNHPPHYKTGGVEVIDLTEQLDFNRGNAVKYLARAGKKDGADELEDLKKARWYVERAIAKLEKERG